MKKNILIIPLLLVSFFTTAQEPQDSLQQKVVKQIKERFPRTRILNLVKV